MKKIFAILLALLCCLTAFAALAEDYSVYTTEELQAMSAAINAELTARIDAARTPSAAVNFLWASNGTEVRINAYLGNAFDVVIPEEIDGVPVTQIGTDAFKNQKNIFNLTLPSGLTTVGKASFAHTHGLNDVLELPAAVQVIEAEAFTGSKYKGIVLNSGFAVKGYNPFYMSELEFVYIREGAAPALNNRSFNGCKKLALAIIPASVTTITDQAFLECPYLKIITPAGSAAEAYAKANFIPVDTASYEQIAAQYDALYPVR